MTNGYVYQIPMVYDVKNKDVNKRNEVLIMLNRLISLFKRENLPEGLNDYDLNMQLFVNGFCVIPEKINGKYYSFTGNLGGVLDEYYHPTVFNIANPYLQYTKSVKIKDDEEGVLIKNDSSCVGLMPIIEKYSDAIVENNITFRVADINTRIALIIAAGDDSSKQSAELFLKKISDGDLGIIKDNAFLRDMGGLQVQKGAEAGGSNLFTQLIEVNNYYKSQMFIDLGLNSNYNMKRESLNDDEINADDDILFTLIDDMLKCQKESWDRFNKRFGENVQVELGGEWETLKKEKELEEEVVENNIEKVENEEPIIDEEIDESNKEKIIEEEKEEVNEDGVKDDVKEE